MAETSVRKTFKEKLRPTPAQERALDEVLWRCRTLYNAALEQRKTWWGRGQGRSATYSQQKAELPDLKAAHPEYAEVHSQVVQDVLLRLDRAFQAFFRRVRAGEQHGYPRFQGRDRYHSLTSWAPTASSPPSGASPAGSSMASEPRCARTSQPPATASAPWSRASSLPPRASSLRALPAACPPLSTSTYCS